MHATMTNTITALNMAMATMATTTPMTMGIIFAVVENENQRKTRIVLLSIPETSSNGKY